MTSDDGCPLEARVSPAVSIILPARNEERSIERALDALNALAYPRERYEVIVVDNGSTDATTRIARSRGVQVLQHPEGRVGAVRNAGAAGATGSILAFLDADCLVPRGWLSSAVDALQRPGVGAVGGPCAAPETGTWVERAWAGSAPAMAREVSKLASSSLILYRSLFERLGGFDESLAAGEDDDLSRRVQDSGCRLLTVPGCRVVHLGYPRALRGVLRRQLWHGRSQLQVAQGHLDPLLLLTHLFAASAIMAIGLGLTGHWAVAGMALLGSGGLALAAALKRADRGLGHALQLTAIFWFFLLGRSLGLVLSYWDLIKARFRPGAREVREE